MTKQLLSAHRIRSDRIQVPALLCKQISNSHLIRGSLITSARLLLNFLSRKSRRSAKKASSDAVRKAPEVKLIKSGLLSSTTKTIQE